MKREIETKFYEFLQNNSGGYFDEDENVCHRVVIEAIDENNARTIFEPMIENQTDSCSCCGDRWSPEYADEINMSDVSKQGFASIEEYCQFLANGYGWTTPDIRIHYLDGTKKEIFKIKSK